MILVLLFLFSALLGMHDQGPTIVWHGLIGKYHNQDNTYFVADLNSPAGSRHIIARTRRISRLTKRYVVEYWIHGQFIAFHYNPQINKQCFNFLRAEFKK